MKLDRACSVVPTLSSTLMPVRKWMARSHGWKESFGLFVLLLSFLFMHFGLLQAHGAEAYHSPAPSPDVTISAPANPPPEVSPQDDAPDASTERGNAGHQDQPAHGHDGETPVCHADSHDACLTSGRSFADELADLSSWLALAMTSLVVSILVLRRNVAAHGSWSSRPHWRPSGTALLTLSCVSRT